MKLREILPLLPRIVHWLLVIVLLIYLITGLAIAYYQVMQVVTFGLLSKLLATKIHDALLLPFVILIVIHVIMVILTGRQRRRKKNSINRD